MGVVSSIGLGRRVEKHYKFGTYTAGFLEEIPPLGSDRKTHFVHDAGPDKMAALSSVTLGIFLANLMKSMVEYFGEEVWEVAVRLGYEIGRQRAATMIRTMEINDFSDALGVRVKKPVLSKICLWVIHIMSTREKSSLSVNYP